MTDQERLEEIKKNYFENGELKALDFDYLQEQAEEKQELEKRINDMKSRVSTFNRACQYYFEQNKRYEKALEFYADKRMYREMADPSGVLTVIEDEYGKKAREALQNK
ncbi:hypothetical protein [Paraliobacillus ryukyuensis]|uniref:hypothetical protein n=1 Tax=Paraliobacillus ryukyuensis TaxID=200904 RepID=UPI0009A5D414|nr:hypothetical protein [Paraliobacillus ryukyuensis]